MKSKSKSTKSEPKAEKSENIKITEKTKMEELTESITKASNKIMLNYFENKFSSDNDNKDITKTFTEFGTKLINEPKEMEKVQGLYKEFFSSQQELWKRITDRQTKPEEYNPVIKPAEGDKRFKAPEWDEAPYYFDFVKQNYLLVSQLMKQVSAGN